MAAQYVHQVEQVNVLTALHRRIAVLETQLAQVYADKQQADQATQYLLYMTAKNHGAAPSDTDDREDLQRLRRKLRQSQKEKSHLRLKLRKAVMLWGNNVHTQMVSPDSHGSNESGSAHTRLTCPKAGAEANCSTQNTSENTLVDLLDCLSVDDLPDLDDTNQESEVDDDLDSLGSYTYGIPQINLGASGDCVVQDARKDSRTGILDYSESSPIRHFSSDESTAVEKIGSRNARAKEKEETLTAPKADTATIPRNPYAEQHPSRRNVSGPKSSVSPPKRPLEIDTQDATCGPDKLFSSVGERQTAIQINRQVAGSEDLKFPDLFRYGIHYNPSLQQSSTLRTISIMNLPPKISRSELLANVRGGIIVSADLLDTVSITRSFSALVVFLHGQDALAFEDFVADNPLYFGGQKAHVKLLTTSTWPLSVMLSTAIFQHHHTRCLEIFNYPRTITPNMLRKDLRLHQTLTYDAIERVQMRSDNVLEIHFLSIQAAGRAYGKLTTMRAYKQCRVVFAKDPCSLPLENLKVKEGANVDASPSAPGNEQIVGSKAIGSETVRLEVPASGTEVLDASKPKRNLYSSVWAPPASYQVLTESSQSDNPALLLRSSEAMPPPQQQPRIANAQKKIFVPAKPIEAKEPDTGSFASANFEDAVPNPQPVTGERKKKGVVNPANPPAADEPVHGSHPLDDLTPFAPSHQTNPDHDTQPT
ncbi:MAG: hypothetical protein Q9187_007176, partial [Circinaria calcarea]